MTNNIIATVTINPINLQQALAQNIARKRVTVKSDFAGEQTFGIWNDTIAKLHDLAWNHFVKFHDKAGTVKTVTVPAEYKKAVGALCKIVGDIANNNGDTAKFAGTSDVCNLIAGFAWTKKVHCTDEYKNVKDAEKEAKTLLTAYCIETGLDKNNTTDVKLQDLRADYEAYKKVRKELEEEVGHVWYEFERISKPQFKKNIELWIGNKIRDIKLMTADEIAAHNEAVKAARKADKKAAK